MIRARIRVDGRLAGSLQALLGAPLAACSGCDERDGGIGHGKRRSRTGLARVCRDVPDLIGHELVTGRGCPVFRGIVLTPCGGTHHGSLRGPLFLALSLQAAVLAVVYCIYGRGGPGIGCWRMSKYGDR